MVALFRDKSATSVFWLILLSILLHVHFFINPPQVVITTNDGFISMLSKPLSVLPSIVITLLYHVIVVLQALRLNYILNDLRMFYKTAYTTAMAYVMLTALYPSWNNLTPSLLINSSLIWLIYRFAKLHNAPNPKTLIFNIGLITGTTVLLFNPACTLILVMLLALAILRPFRANEWLILIMGIVTPFYFLSAFLYLQNNLGVLHALLNGFYLQLLSPADKIPMLTSVIIMGVLFLSGFYIWQMNSGRMVIQSRKNWSILLLMVLLLVPVIFLKNTGFDYLLLSIVPVAAFASNIFLYPRSGLLPNLLFWVLIAVIGYNNWIWLKN